MTAEEITADSPVFVIRRFEVRMASGELDGTGLVNALEWLDLYAFFHHYPAAVPERIEAEIEALRSQYVRTN